MFNKIHGIHIEGHKHMSTTKPIMDCLDPDFVYYPLAVGNAVYTKLVEVGSKVLMGQQILLRDGRFGHPICSSVSGTVTAIKKQWHSSGKMIDMLEIQNDHQDLACYSPTNNDNLSRDEIIEKVKNAGIVGLGGAGFPTYVKYLPAQPADYVIINAAECEPYLTCDQMCLLEVTDKFIRGVKYIMMANMAKKGVVAVKKSHPDVIEALNKALEGIDDISLYLLNDVYPAGWEKYIVEHVTKKSYSGLPREAGAVVNNVQTAIAVCEAVEENKPLIDRVVTITGDGIKEPQNYRVKIGSKITSLIELSNGYVEDLGDAICICGGPMTGRPMFFDELVITSTVGAIIVNKRNVAKAYPCIGCGKCSENCPAYLTPTSIKQAYLSGNTSELASLNVNRCVQCGLCSYVCPSRVDMTDYMAKAKDMLAKANVKK